MLLQAVQEVMSDEGFQLPSPLAAAALQTSKCVLSWSRDPNNHHIFKAFANSLHAKLHKAFEVSARKFQRRREKIWGSYHSIRCSDDFVDSWKRFLAKAFCETATPIFYQHITDRIFRKMMKVAFPVAESSKTVTPSPISNSELNALRYAAGYVCRTVRKRIKRMKPVNILLKLSLEELLEDDSAGCNAMFVVVVRVVARIIENAMMMLVVMPLTVVMVMVIAAMMMRVMVEPVMLVVVKAMVIETVMVTMMVMVAMVPFAVRQIVQHQFHLHVGGYKL